MDRSLRSHGFTLLETVALLIVLALVAGLVLPMFSKSQRRGRVYGGSTHLRGVHSGLVLYAQGNKDFYPGLTASGERDTRPLAATPGTYGTQSTSGYDPTYRMSVLLRGGYFSPEYMISPHEMGSNKVLIQPGQDVTSINFSNAMLRLAAEGETEAVGRRAEWRATNNSLAAVLSDRNIGPAAGAKAQSFHTSEGDGWRGTVVYNDNHSLFETTNIVATQYGIAQYRTDERGLTGTQADDLFADDKDNAGKAGNDAAMVHQDEKTYVNQH